MSRAVLMTFYGEYRGHGEPHEAPRSMTGVLVALASVTVVAGLVGSPQLGAVFGKWVYFQELEEALFVPWVAVLSTLAALGGILIGYALYRDYQARDPLRSLGGAYTLVANKFYIDDIYWKGIVRPIRDDVSSGVYWNDRHVIDGVVNGTAAVTAISFDSLAPVTLTNNVIQATGINATAVDIRYPSDEIVSGNSVTVVASSGDAVVLPGDPPWIAGTDRRKTGPRFQTVG
jgi:NADH:ubiquinone oxidoreductase subunit 5 (subunit L)/multisubunit Na+/H+ antiporter MnhA subunit